MTYTVVGAGGPTGSQCVERLLTATSENVRAIVRDPSKYSNLAKDPRVEVVQGDVTSKDSLVTALKGSKGVIFAASGKGFWSADSVDHKGVAAVAEACQAAGGVERVVLVSSQKVDPKNRFHPVRVLLNNIRWSLMDAKWKGEQALRSSGVPYTIVRPGGLTNGAGGAAPVMAGQGDNQAMPGPISRADVAAVCVAALSTPASKNVTVEVSSKKEKATPEQFSSSLKSLFDGLKADA